MSRFICKILCFCGFLCTTSTLFAAPKERPKAELDSILYHGTEVGLNLSDPFVLLSGSDTWKASVKAEANLWNKYLPALEIGYHSILYDKDLTDFSSKACFAKIGVNFPIARNETNFSDRIFTGFHYGFSAFSYHLQQAKFAASYWDEAYTGNFMNERAFAHWIEIQAGVHVHLSGPISLGWTGYMQSFFKPKNGKHSVPPYFPGYGIDDKPVYHFAVYLYYKLPW